MISFLGMQWEVAWCCLTPFLKKNWKLIEKMEDLQARPFWCWLLCSRPQSFVLLGFQASVSLFFELSAFGLLGLWALGPFEDNFMKQIPGYPSNSLPVIHISRDLARKMAEWLGTFFSWLIRSPFPWGDTKKWPLESTYLAIAFGWCQGVFILMRKKVRFALEVNQACWSNWNIASTKVSFF